MNKEEISAELIDIKSRITNLGIKYIECQLPVSLTDVAKTLTPFTNIDNALDYAIKRLSSDTVPGSIPKTSTLSS